MADSTKDKIKYGLLKGIDVSGFKVLDPPVRLLFGEEPRKQVQDIAKYMLLPIVFVLVCLAVWTVMGPNHKTKSGEVPTPARVMTAYQDNVRFDERQQEKADDFIVAGTEREETLAETQAELARLEEEAGRLAKESASVAAEAKLETESKLSPLKANLDELKAVHKAAEDTRDAEMEKLAEAVVAKEAQPEQLVALLRQNEAIEDAEKEKEDLIKDQIDEVLANPPSEVKEAQMAANRVADEVQHYKKRIAILTNENRNVKEAEYLAKVEEGTAGLATAEDPKKVVREAKSIAKNAERAEDAKTQTYPRTATIFWQTKRSIATVFVGFLLAAALAIPIGIMCGLNRIVMACLTPIISIFRPVSPVVWLLIFQIIIGAFFPDPETHPLFVTLNNDKWFGWIVNPIAFLQTNPAMIFSACTVAMCALWPALVNTALGVSSIDKDHLNVANVLRLGFWSRLFKIIIPSSLPLVFAGLRISLGVGWMVLIAAEALSSSDGLGKFVWDEYQNGSSQSFANIILACFVVGIIGFFLDRIMIFLQRLVSFDDGSATA
ncbi:nitrate ABC transporter permease [Haloferula helveola]|uniref:Nitrate ABC transporter permease n=1 Tax=Haloferula helveola TaxID=490095 RepID=A0ABN6H8T5_9BACT|nr:nitrate ABC transporter permease [Haloferula helveola]